jgi:hypothetical protein
LRGSHVKSCSEQKWEAHHIVDLVWIVRSTSSNNAIWSYFLCYFGSYFRFWICHSKNDWVLIQTFDHFFSKCTCCWYSNKDICTFACFFKRCVLVYCISGKLFFEWIHTFFSSLKNDSICITN